MIGEKYGRFTILSVTSKGKHTKVLCECECGKTKEVRYDHIKSGRSNSCGCYLTEVLSSDISNMKFGRLKAIKFSYNNERKERLWECLCDCGKTVFVKSSLLKSGNTQSCGCSRHSLLEGLRFGKLVVLDINKSTNTGLHWRCKCDCGNECIRSSSALNGGGAVSCGCARFTSKKNPYSTKEFRDRSRISGSTRRAIKNKAKGSYTVEQINDLHKKQKGKCANCKKKLKDIFHRDHIYPLSRGGSNDIHNIQLSCQHCNCTKYCLDPIVFANRQGRLI